MKQQRSAKNAAQRNPAQRNAAQKNTVQPVLQPLSNGLPACRAFGKCGGCDYIGTEYERQLKFKQTETERLIGNYGPVFPITPAKHPLHYRNKVTAAFGYEKGRVISGVYEKYSHRIVNVSSCKIEDVTADGIIRTIRELLPSFRIKTYDEDSGYGLLRHVMVRTGRKTKEVMVILVTAGPVFAGKEQFRARAEASAMPGNHDGHPERESACGPAWCSETQREGPVRERVYRGHPVRTPVPDLVADPSIR
jgi:tRNA/tmRNA/rRNA uracil-C5-methylase (TrmA/RlmC/RlmD family)